MAHEIADRPRTRSPTVAQAADKCATWNLLSMSPFDTRHLQQLTAGPRRPNPVGRPAKGKDELSQIARIRRAAQLLRAAGWIVKEPT